MLVQINCIERASGVLGGDIHRYLVTKLRTKIRDLVVWMRLPK